MYYKTISELPAIKYCKCLAENDIRYLLHEDVSEKELKKVLPGLQKAWENIEIEVYDELLKRADFQDVIDELRVSAETLSKAGAGDVARRMMLKAQAINSDLVEEKKTDFHQNIIQIERYFKMAIDETKITTRKYFGYLKMLIDGN
jgi:hypothetical protein